MTRGARAQTGWTADEIEHATGLLPYLQAAQVGLRRSRWRPGEDVNELLAPITLAVLAEAGKRLFEAKPGKEET